MTVPVVKLAEGDARYRAAPTISSGRPALRRADECCSAAVTASRSQALLMSVRKGPAMMLLTRTAGPYARARPIVSTSRPALAAAYGSAPDEGLTASTEEMLMIAPDPARAILAPISVPRRNGPLRLTANTLSYSA